MQTVALIRCSTLADSLAGHYTQIVTGHYSSITPIAVVGCIEPFVLRKSQHMNILELLNNQIFGNNDRV